jgi:hypothetical protein
MILTDVLDYAGVVVMAGMAAFVAVLMWKTR